MALSNYLEEALLNHIFRTTSFSQPSTIALALLTTAPVDTDTGEFTAGTGVEVSNTNNYARVNLGAPADATWTSPSAGTQGQIDNVGTISFPIASGGDWGTIVAVAIVDSTTYDAGNLLFYGNLTTPRAVTDGDTFRFNVGDLDISLT